MTLLGITAHATKHGMMSGLFMLHANKIGPMTHSHDPILQHATN